jgi:chromosome partitioning protein
MLMSWALVNLKPGVGKTTSAVFFAHALHRRGLRPLLVDSDPAASALRWADLAGGFAFPVVGLAIPGVYREIDHYTRDVDAVVIDAPQLEDHAKIARGAMRYASCWIAPVAPAGIEVDRMSSVADEWDDVQSLRGTLADPVVLLNRTNKPEPTRTGPDAEVRAVLVERGYDVLTTQVPHHDALYRQAFGVPVEVEGTAYVDLADELVTRAEKRAA